MTDRPRGVGPHRAVLEELWLRAAHDGVAREETPCGAGQAGTNTGTHNGEPCWGLATAPLSAAGGRQQMEDEGGGFGWPSALPALVCSQLATNSSGLPALSLFCS